MRQFSILIQGLVQGVGFRPLLRQLALEQGLNGWVKNGSDGVEIRLQCQRDQAESYLKRLLRRAPANAIIQETRIMEIPFTEHLEGFTLNESQQAPKTSTILPPDTALCADCLQEILDPQNRRFRYPFTTCLNCGPRASIIRTLPYDRPRTTMAHLPMCPACQREYRLSGGRREHSQTNSCPDCAIPMHLYDRRGKEISNNWEEIHDLLIHALNRAEIVAIKGIGGYHLLADASQEHAVRLLRKRKNRVQKPFAILYKDLDAARRDVAISKTEEEALLSPMAPVVLCKKLLASGSGACTEWIAPGLERLGVLLPYTPLLWLISHSFKGPLLATSANLSGAPMIFKDDQALKLLPELADFILSFERDIVMPLDDSVVVFNEHQLRIILRRGRGFVLQQSLLVEDKDQAAILATGAELKGSFVMTDRRQTLLSAYLGDQQNLDARESYEHTLEHLQRLYTFHPELILADDHPTYAIHQSAAYRAAKEQIPLHLIQHHRAHFAAVLAEHNLLYTPSPALGFIWDGSGYGDDGQIWGGEVFRKEGLEFQRVLHLDYFPLIAGDKMNREPRLSALSMLSALPQHLSVLRPVFSTREWNFYQKVLKTNSSVLSSSMGRLLDAVACLLGLCTHNSYEGEAAMKLESLASKARAAALVPYPFRVEGPLILWQPFLESLMADIHKGENPAVIAQNTFVSLADLIFNIAKTQQVSCLAFSGGVFQNALLTDLISEHFAGHDQFSLCFHRNVSPNDENIALGQYAFHRLKQSARSPSTTITKEMLCA